MVSPFVRLFLFVAQPNGTLRHALVGLVINRLPVADPSPDRDDHFGETNPPEALAIIRKATFQWASGLCLAVHESRIGQRQVEHSNLGTVGYATLTSPRNLSHDCTLLN